MSLSTIASEDDIVAAIKTIPGIDVLQGEYTPDGWKPALDANKMFKPYVLVNFNGGFPAYDNGIVGSFYDTQRATFSVYCVAPGDRAARVIRDQVRAKILSPTLNLTDASRPEPNGSYSFVDPDLGWTRYVYNIGFRYNYNLNYTV